MNYYRKKNVYELNKSYDVKYHSHSLFYTGIDDSQKWTCSGNLLNEGCFSGLTSSSQTKGFERFKCYKCDFNLCRNCMDNYLKEGTCNIF